MPDRPGATVVVPTFRRPDGLNEALAGLSRQAEPGVQWALVVVDNDDAPGAEPVFTRWKDRLPVTARLVREGRRGASAARNRGITESDTDLTVFLDDDVRPEPDWLRRLLAPITAGEADATGGRVVLDPSVPRPRWFNEEHFGPYLGAYSGRPDLQTRPDEPPYVLTASAAFRTELLRRVGGLDPVLGPRSGVPLVNDDIELCRQVVALGGRLRYVDDAVVVHELPPARLTRRYVLRRLYAQGRSDWLIERDQLVQRPLGGAGGAVRAMAGSLPEAVRRGAWRRETRYWLLGQAAATAGVLREALAGVARRRHGRAVGGTVG